LRFAKSGIDTPLKILSIFGVISGVFLLSGLAYAALTLGRGPADYSSPFTVPSLALLGVMDALLAIFGGLVALTANMSIDRRSGLVFLVTLASIFATFGVLGFLSLVFLGPQ
jgi:hypothetical protein